MTLSPEQARFMGVAIATAMNELEITLPSEKGVVRPVPVPKAPRKQKAKPKASTPKKTEPKAPVKRKASSKKKKDPLAPQKSKSTTSRKKRRSPEENSKIVHVVNGYLGMAKKASTQTGARIWLLKATKTTPSGWTATHNQIARKHAAFCPDIAA